MIFCLASTAIDLFVEPARRTLFEIGDDEAGVGALIAHFDAGNDPLDAAPALGAVIKCLEPAQFTRARPTGERGIEACPGAGFADR